MNSKKPQNKNSKTQKPPLEPGGRATILRAAAALLCEQGYSATSMRQIAATAGMRAASIYHHFPSKEDLVDEILRMSLSILTEDLNSMLASLPAGLSELERLAAAMQAHLCGILSSDEHTIAFMKIWSHLPTSMKKRVSADRRKYGVLWTEIISSARKSGAISYSASEYMVASFIVGSMNRVLEWYRPSMGTVDQVSSFVVNSLLLGLIKREGSAAATGKRSSIKSDSRKPARRASVVI